jgi:hypothetical protein
MAEAAAKCFLQPRMRGDGFWIQQTSLTSLDLAGPSLIMLARSLLV